MKLEGKEGDDIATGQRVGAPDLEEETKRYR